MFANTSALAEDVAQGHLTLEQGVESHLRVAIWPAKPSMKGPAVEAVKACRAGSYNTPVKLPDGTLHKNQKFAPARELVERLHLEPFLD